MREFSSLGIDERLVKSLEQLKFKKPTPIQEKAIPIAMQGRDILGSAQTGTGKTAAFGIPLLSGLMSNHQDSALIITPTRELATQVMRALQEILGRKTKIKAALLIGGEAIGKQLAQLRSKPRLIVGTPGRISDHLKRKTVKFHNTKFLVLDETDRMLDMGFSIQIDEIMKFLPKERQTLLFSATLPPKIVKMARNYMHDPIRIAVESESLTADNVKQESINVSGKDKYDLLVSEIKKRDGSIIIFVKTKFGADKMAKRLTREGYVSKAIHGDLRHNKREHVIKSFRSKKYRIMVATDIAARGLDIPHIEHVINYDLPQCPEDYIHRIGRTARAGAKGEAISFVSSADKTRWREISKLAKLESKEEEKPGKGKESGKGFSNKSKKKPANKGKKFNFKKHKRNKSFNKAEKSNKKRSA